MKFRFKDEKIEIEKLFQYAKNHNIKKKDIASILGMKIDGIVKIGKQEKISLIHLQAVMIELMSNLIIETMRELKEILEIMPTENKYTRIEKGRETHKQFKETLDKINNI